MASRTFNGLSGDELRKIILKELLQELDLDDRFKQHGGLTKLDLMWRLKVATYPSEPQNWSVQVSQSFKAGTDPILLERCPKIIFDRIAASLNNDERFLAHVTYPKVTWDWTLSLDVTSAAGTTRSAEVSASFGPVESQTRQGGTVLNLRGIQDDDLARTSGPDDGYRGQPRTIVPPADPRDEQIDRLERMLAAMQDRLNAMGENVPTPATSPLGGISASELRNQKFDNHTGTGLPIDAEFLPSPGMAAAMPSGSGSHVGVIVGLETERMELGVSHPALEAGGAGAPDALRREHNLPVPTMHSTPAGHIVDLPANTF